MAQAMVNFRMDADLKKSMEDTCKRMGLSLSSAFVMFATKVTNEQRIPFEITAADPFYNKEKLDRLSKPMQQMEAPGGTFHEVNFND